MKNDVKKYKIKAKREQRKTRSHIKKINKKAKKYEKKCDSRTLCPGQ